MTARRGRTAFWATGLLFMVTTGLAAGMVGCGTGGATKSTDSSAFERGAEGDREVAEGPGLFSGEKGELEIDLKKLLRRRAGETADEEETGPE